VVPSDHVVSVNLSFAQAISRGTAKARAGSIVTFGIRPTHPETGYGYIQLAKKADDNDAAQRFSSFVEKPCIETANEMLISGQFLWNSGMFLFSVGAIRKTFGRACPEIRAAVRSSVRAASIDLDFVRLGHDFVTAPSLAFDYAVMEHVDGWVVPMTAGWSDLGSWRSVWAETFKDENGVALRGTSRAFDCEDTLLFSNDDSIEMVGVGLKNIAAIATRDAVLVTDLNDSQSMSKVVATLRAEDLKQADEFTRCERPWGHYESLAMGSRFQVKSIVVKSGGRLSLQSHLHRAEHWVVVEGTATVTIGQEEKLVTENQSVYIPLGETHRLANNGKVPLQLIEVQTGSYLGEDDIVRYEDIYSRA
jgi:mannose-1-phosphate guanylyltransferase/mannose-1-phosphate guanylyltransferase/mannose-6-phosphate isomerase